ncbi:MAG: hypothetical protein HUJ89_02685, partial [Bacteroidales bacterium]|nr:hypothetical protein [Bacteroidales bacterium]
QNDDISLGATPQDDDIPVPDIDIELVPEAEVRPIPKPLHKNRPGRTAGPEKGGKASQVILIILISVVFLVLLFLIIVTFIAPDLLDHLLYSEEELSLLRQMGQL